MIGHESNGGCLSSLGKRYITLSPRLSVGHCHVRISLFVCGVELGLGTLGFVPGEKAGEDLEKGRSWRNEDAKDDCPVRGPGILDRSRSLSVHISLALEERELLIVASTHKTNLRNVQPGASTFLSGSAPSLHYIVLSNSGPWGLIARFSNHTTQWHAARDDAPI